jgi:two-component system cell cycle response regulator DivK
MGKCVLIYDDDKEILFLCSAILLRSNYRVETLSRCENVLSDIALIKPDIILMDLWIPEIGGEKAITIIKEDPATLHIPVIIFSANADLSTICQNIHADGYIEKPFDIAAFNEVVRKNIL